jgi:hypothetical protein
MGSKPNTTLGGPHMYVSSIPATTKPSCTCRDRSSLRASDFYSKHVCAGAPGLLEVFRLASVGIATFVLENSRSLKHYCKFQNLLRTQNNEPNETSQSTPLASTPQAILWAGAGQSQVTRVTCLHQVAVLLYSAACCPRAGRCVCVWSQSQI